MVETRTPTDHPHYQKETETNQIYTAEQMPSVLKYQQQADTLVILVLF